MVRGDEVVEEHELAIGARENPLRGDAPFEQL
jgi:hypothetical protein